MTPDRDQLIQDSWRTVQPSGARFVELAILHLVEIAPAIRPVLEQHPLPQVYEAIAGTIGELVDSIDDPKRLVPLAVRLGRRNPDHGISGGFYPAFGESLIWALHLQLGDSFTAELQTAWIEGYHLVSAIMKRGEQSTTGEFEKIRTGELVAIRNELSK